MKLSDLKKGDLVTYRIGEAGRSSVIWQEWQIGELYIDRRKTPLPQKYRRQTRAPNVGDILVLAILGLPYEFSQGDYDSEFNTFNCEEFYLEIKELKE